jgi:Ca2+-binding RTX toxin-like protein
MALSYRVAPSESASVWTNDPSKGANLTGSIAGSSEDDIYRGAPGTHQEIESHATIDKLTVTDYAGNTYIESKGPRSGNGPNWSIRDSVFNLGDGYVGIISIIDSGNYCYNFVGNTLSMGAGDSDVWISNEGTVYYDQVLLGSDINAGSGDDNIFLLADSGNIATWIHAISGGSYNMGAGEDKIYIEANRGSGGLETATWGIQQAEIDMGDGNDHIAVRSDDYGITDNCFIQMGDGDNALDILAGSKGIESSILDFGTGADDLYIETTDKNGITLKDTNIYMGNGIDRVLLKEGFRSQNSTIDFGGDADYLYINATSGSFDIAKTDPNTWMLRSNTYATCELAVANLEYIIFDDAEFELLGVPTQVGTTPPTLQSTAATSNQLILKFSEDIQIAGGGSLNPAYMTVIVDGQTRKVTRSQITGPDHPTIHTASQLVLTLSGRALDSAKSISVSYNPPSNTTSSGFITDLSDNRLASIATQIVDTFSTSTSIIKSGIASAYKNLILTGSNAINGTGNTQNNTITGNDANNTLDGLAGADSMIGKGGNDTYFIDNAGDVVTEIANEGTDTVQSTITYTLADNLENLTLLGSGAINGTGNSANNILMGNAGANVLNGNGGTDTLIGGRGNDTYIVDSLDDIITESGSSSDIDSVQSSVSWVLGINLENLTLTGSNAINGTGNNLNNTIIGNSANNILDGGTGGTDLLTGLAGADVFKFSTRPSSFRNTTADHITDFSSAEGDKIQITKIVFGINASAATLSVVNTATALNTALSTASLFVYNSTNGELHWNQNGISRGAGSGGVLAILDNRASLSSTDFAFT